MEGTRCERLHHLSIPKFTHEEALEVSITPEGYLSLMEVIPTAFTVYPQEDVAATLSFAMEYEVQDGPGLDQAIAAESGEPDSI